MEVGPLYRGTGRPEVLSVALNIFGREHKQHVERSNDVSAERIAREARTPRRPIGSREHVHLDRMERLTARVAKNAVFHSGT